MPVLRGPAGAIHYAEHGDGPPLVLSHGVIENMRSWDRMVPLLCARFRTVVYDARSRGRSDVAEVTYEALVDDVAALADHLGLAPFFHAGHSMGGRVALDHAAARGSDVRAIAVISGRLVPPSGESCARLSAVLDEVAEHGSGVAVSPWITPAHPLYHEVHDISAANPPDGTRAALRGLLDADSCVVSRLGAIEAPVLVVIGEHDGAPFHEAAELMAERLPRCELLTLPGVGHFPNLEAPERLVAELERFFLGEG
jgi:3-oxoadipate enol-lactonase